MFDVNHFSIVDEGILFENDQEEKVLQRVVLQNIDVVDVKSVKEKDLDYCTLLGVQELQEVVDSQKNKDHQVNNIYALSTLIERTPKENKEDILVPEEEVKDVQNVNIIQN